jgi:hypothetical protein
VTFDHPPLNVFGPETIPQLNDLRPRPEAWDGLRCRDEREAQGARSPEELFLALALTDLRQAADLFRPIHDRTNGGDGWVSLEL